MTSRGRYSTVSDPYELAEALTEDWRASDDDRSMSEFLLLTAEEYVEYVREDVLPVDFVERHWWIES
jgi:hypothetical protein